MKIVEAFLDLNDLHRWYNSLYISELSRFANIHYCLLLNIFFKLYP